jgi:hypothetical protein
MLLAVLDRVMYPSLLRTSRPQLDVLDCEDYIKCCLTECWQDDPNERPDFRAVRQKLGPMQRGV